MGHHGSTHQFVVGKRSCLNAAVPLPANTSDSAWDDTLCELPRVIHRCMSYSDMRDAAGSGDTRMRGFLNWICSSFWQ